MVNDQAMVDEAQATEILRDLVDPATLERLLRAAEDFADKWTGYVLTVGQVAFMPIATARH